jgi:ABC-type amino acid transport substrate-binding protein
MLRELFFSSNYYRSWDNNFGSRLENGSWNGLIGMVVRGAVDVVVAYTYWTEDRAQAVDFITPIEQYR